MSYLSDKFRFLETSVNRDPLIFQEIMNARLGGMSIMFIDEADFNQLDPKDNNTLYLVSVDSNTLNLYKGSVRIRLDGVVAEYNHAIITRQP